MSYTSQNNFLIFAEINIYNINIGKSKIDELNQNFQNLTEIVKHKSFRDSIEIEQLIIKIKTILNMIIDETKINSNNEQNSYFNALKSTLFFLQYLSEYIVDKIDINKDIYDEYRNYIDNLISELMPNLNEFDVKIYEWLVENNYIHYNTSLQLYSKNELKEFYNTSHREIIDFVLTQDINKFYPYYNIGGIQAFLQLSKDIEN